MGDSLYKDGRCIIVAEVSANHGGSLDRAMEMIAAAKDCGADAVKFQAYRPDTLTIDADTQPFRIEHSQWGGQSLYQLYTKTATPWEWFPPLKRRSEELGITFLCTAFDPTSVAMLEDLGVVAHKVSSFELVDIDLVACAGRTGKPLILSTGMASAEEIQEALDAARQAGAGEITLLKCVSSYPALPEEMNLRVIPHMAEQFGCAVGLSDHSLGIGAAVCAVALGARIIEKHFKLDEKMQTPDSFFSITPPQFRELVEAVRVAEQALGNVHYGMTAQEQKNRVFRRSLFVVKDMSVGETFDTANVRSIRPGYGLAPKYLSRVLGRRAKRAIRRGTPLDWELVD